METALLHKELGPATLQGPGEWAPARGDMRHRIGRLQWGPGDAVHAAFASAAGSGSMSSKLTSPPVKSRTAFSLSRGTPLLFHCDTAEAVKEKWAASAVARPFSASSHSIKFMPHSLGEPKPRCQELSKPRFSSIDCVTKDARRLRFAAYFRERFGDDRAKFMRATGLTKGRVTQLFDDNEPFGELAASRLAHKLGLPPDYFERDHASGDADSMARSDRERRWLQAFRDLPPARADARLRSVAAEAQEFREYAEAKSKRDAPLRPAVDDESTPTDAFVGGTSGFGGLDDVATLRRRGYIADTAGAAWRNPTFALGAVMVLASQITHRIRGK